MLFQQSNKYTTENLCTYHLNNQMQIKHALNTDRSSLFNVKDKGQIARLEFAHLLALVNTINTTMPIRD